MAVPVDIPVARAFWLAEPGRGEIRAEPLPLVPPTGWLRIRTLYTAISRGTEGRVFRGEVPASEARRMRAPFQLGDFPAPVKYGYCNVGRVVGGDADRLGDLVCCLYPHQTLYDVPAVAAHRLPPGLPAARAVLAPNLETAVNAIWDLQALPGDRIAVVGGGVVGLLVGWLAAAIPGCRVELIDPSPARRAVADALGLTLVTPDAATADVDAVVHASGDPAGLVTALGLAGPEATIVELSWYGNRSVALPLGEAFHSRRLTIRSSQVGRIAPSREPRWTPARRMGLVLALLGDPRLDALISDESPFEQLPTVLARLATTPSPMTLCHRIRYGDETAGRTRNEEENRDVPTRCP